jgi:hypothetical protein
MRNAGSIFVYVILLIASGCASAPPASTRLTTSDYRYTVDETAAKLAASDFLANRDANSPKIVVTIDRVENLTSDIIPEAEQWMFVMDVRDSLPMSSLLHDRNVAFQIPPERLQMLRDNGYASVNSGWEPATHLLSATFRSAMRSQQNDAGFIQDRTDQYSLEYTITNVKTGAVEWSSIVEFKRVASGNTIN